MTAAVAFLSGTLRSCRTEGSGFQAIRQMRSLLDASLPAAIGWGAEFHAV